MTDPFTSAPISVQSLGSGSSGNAFLVTTPQANLMIDFGVGIRTIRRALKERDLATDDLSAVLVTHEHSDHIRALSYITGTHVPIVSTMGTCRRGNIPPPQWEQIEYHRPLSIGDVTVWAIMVKHDAAEPCGYLLETSAARVSIFTDLGSWHDRLVAPIAASDLVVLESNHDVEMLRRGPYPPHLKRRVASDAGHLSNAVCGASLASTLGDGRAEPDIWLAHLSNTNNAPHVAETETRLALEARDVSLPVLALPRTEPGPVWVPRSSRVDGGSWSPEQPAPPASMQLSMDGLF